MRDVEQIVDEIERNRYLYEPGLRAGISWDELLAGARQDAQAIIVRDGAFVMSENHGLFTCR